MVPQPTFLSIPELIELEISNALEAFQREQRISTDLDDLLANDIRSYTASAKHRRGGRVEITVEIVGSKSWQDHYHFAVYYTFGSGLRLDDHNM